MPRTCSVELKTHLAGEVITDALIYLITRRDGTQLGITTCQHDLDVDGITYHAETGLDPSALQMVSGLRSDNETIAGILSSDLISKEDVIAGRYQSADVKIWLVNYEDLTMGTLPLSRGYIGNTKVSTDELFVVDFRSLSQKLMNQIGELTSTVCRVRRLGDVRCKVDLDGQTVDGYDISTTTTITTATSRRVLAATGLSAFPEGFYSEGWIEFNDGANEGLEMEVLFSDTGVITLFEPMPFDFEVGDSITAIAGCDRLFDTCINKFNNAVNYRGEPHLTTIEKAHEIF